MATPVTADGDFVVCDRLRGHKGQVLCVAAPDPKVGFACAIALSYLSCFARPGQGLVLILYSSVVRVLFIPGLVCDL